MSITTILAQFAHDKQLGLVITLIVADFIFGVSAAFKLGTFRTGYIANFVRNDLLKVGLWFGIFALDHASNAAGIVGPVDWSQANFVVFGAITLAMAGSIMASLRDLGINLPLSLAGHAPGSAPVSVPPRG